MCTGCGRPQPARSGPCVVCGRQLPDAPLPASPAPQAPFLSLEWGGGRVLTGTARQLAFRPDASSAPVVVELGNLESLTFGRRFFFEALAIIPVAAVLGILVPSSRLVTTALGFLALLVALLWRRYFLALRWLNGDSTRWPLGTARVGSRRARHIDEAWSSAAPSLATQGVTVRETGPFVPRA
jgi:hypothetical protein